LVVGSPADGVGQLMRARVPHQYNVALDREIGRRVRMAGDLQQAVSDQEFLLQYQPQVRLDTLPAQEPGHFGHPASPAGGF
jgi:hypothetical protein